MLFTYFFLSVCWRQKEDVCNNPAVNSAPKVPISGESTGGQEGAIAPLL